MIPDDLIDFVSVRVHQDTQKTGEASLIWKRPEYQVAPWNHRNQLSVNPAHCLQLWSIFQNKVWHTLCLSHVSYIPAAPRTLRCRSPLPWVLAQCRAAWWEHTCAAWAAGAQLLPNGMVHLLQAPTHFSSTPEATLHPAGLTVSVLKEMPVPFQYFLTFQHYSHWAPYCRW